ncbi:MAG TPA: hypothetical protein VJ486_14080 [Geothrix sp.]|nr:hypothetical protein [Geothrix sp.]
MTCETQGERRLGSEDRKAESRGGLWSLPDGHRLPNMTDSVPMELGDPTHPARLRPSDLEDPEGFHTRLNRWLLQQG